MAHSNGTYVGSGEPVFLHQAKVFLRRVRGSRALAMQETAVLIAFFVIIFTFYLINPAILSKVTVVSSLRAMAFPGLIGMGLVLVMICKEIDLSTGSVMSLTAVSSAWLLTEPQFPLWLCVVIPLGIALVVGLINGLLTARIGLNSVIATLGTLFVVRGISYLLTGGNPIYPLPPEAAIVGTLRPLGISVAFFVMLFVMIVIHIVLNGTRLGAAVYATGGNMVAAEMCGIKTTRIKILCFILTSFFAGIAGLLVMSQLPIPSGDPIIGRQIELDIIVGVVLGGVSLFGGRGSAIGTFIGVLIMQVVRTGIVLSHVNPFWQIPVLGFLLVFAISVDVLRHRHKE